VVIFSDEFDDMGILDGKFPSDLCPISAVRVTLKHSSDYWVILSEVNLNNLTPNMEIGFLSTVADWL
jgi:hypothetical protein